MVGGRKVTNEPDCYVDVTERSIIAPPAVVTTSQTTVFNKHASDSCNVNAEESVYLSLIKGYSRFGFVLLYKNLAEKKCGLTCPSTKNHPPINQATQGIISLFVHIVPYLTPHS